MLIRLLMLFDDFYYRIIKMEEFYHQYFLIDLMKYLIFGLDCILNL